MTSISILMMTSRVTHFSSTTTPTTKYRQREHTTTSKEIQVIQGSRCTTITTREKCHIFLVDSKFNFITHVSHDFSVKNALLTYIGIGLVRDSQFNIF